ncbi:MAG: TIGR02391 family protein [Phycisphaerales bacterium]
MEEPVHPLAMRFDPQTIRHLGLRMYSSLAPALAEIISNSYDADASNVSITLEEEEGVPARITVTDDGSGLAYEDIRDKLLVIGRNRREDGDDPSPKHKRLSTGKKGLGKLALFGLASTITFITQKAGKLNEFVLDWDELNSAKGTYLPKSIRVNEQTSSADGTTIVLTGLKRKTAFDPAGLADSLSRIFVVDDTFRITVKSPKGDRIAIDNTRKYETIETEFTWDIESTLLVPEASEYRGELKGKLLTAIKPIAPASGLRGITLYSRGKLVNAPEFFSSSASSHFYQYLTGWITVDFIDKLDDDVISTNRQSLDWEHPQMINFRKFLAGIVSQVNGDWRRKRKEKKDADLQSMTGIDTKAWIGTMPPEVGQNTQRIIDALGGEDAFENFTPVIKALHEIVPNYPLLHWRHLHDALQRRVRSFYEHKQYGIAASEGVKIYCETIRSLTGRTTDGRSLVDGVFGSAPFTPPIELQLNDLSTESYKNIQEGQGHLSRGVVTGFRNPVTHSPIDTVVPAVFSEVDCLNVLSLTSYLLTRLDHASYNNPALRSPSVATRPA